LANKQQLRRGSRGSLVLLAKTCPDCNLFKGDNSQCQHCGDSSGPFELDHLIPLAADTKDRPHPGDVKANVVVSCVSCNRRKLHFRQDWEMFEELEAMYAYLQ
jgi:hypothetical protein